MDTGDERVGPPPTDEGRDPGHGRAWSSFTDSQTGTRVIRAGATLDAAAAAALRREASALLARSVRSLMVDLAAVRAAEPAAASAVLRDLAYEAGDADVDLRVVADPGAPELTRAVLDDETLFEVYPTLDAALQRAGDRTGPPPGPHPGHPPPGER